MAPIFDRDSLSPLANSHRPSLASIAGLRDVDVVPARLTLMRARRRGVAAH
jgi:hypothetical protein